MENQIDVQARAQAMTLARRSVGLSIDSIGKIKTSRQHCETIDKIYIGTLKPHNCSLCNMSVEHLYRNNQIGIIPDWRCKNCLDRPLIREVNDLLKNEALDRMERKI